MDRYRRSTSDWLVNQADDQVRVSACTEEKRIRSCVTRIIRLAAAILIAGLSERVAAEQVSLPPIVFEANPSAASPRNSEGAFIALKNGNLLFLYSQFYGGTQDHSAAHIAAIESDDHGRTWSQPPRVAIENAARFGFMSVSLLRLQDGRLALFHKFKQSFLDNPPIVRFSEDEGKSWSEPVTVVSAPGYFVMNNDRAIQHRSGRLIVPVGFHRSKGKDGDDPRILDMRSVAIFYLSDDGGRSWYEGPQWLTLAEPATQTGLQEPGVVELSDGSLLAWFRTDQGAQYESRSQDAGLTWTVPQPGPMKSPPSPASIKRIPGTDHLLGVWNDYSEEFFPRPADPQTGHPHPRGRTPLVVAISEDGGKSWPRRKRLENKPDGWYCYTAIHFTEDAMLLAYCAGDSVVGRLNRLRMRRIPLEWLP